MDLKYFSRGRGLNSLENVVFFIILSLCMFIDETWTLPGAGPGDVRSQNFTTSYSHHRRKRGNAQDFLGRISSERVLDMGADDGSGEQDDETCCVLSTTEQNTCDTKCEAGQAEVCTCDFHFAFGTCTWECLDDPPDPPDPGDHSDEDGGRKKRSPRIRHHSKSRLRHKHHHRPGFKHH